MPKRGFVNQYAKKYQPLNLERLQHWVKDGRLNPEKVTLTELVQSRCVHKLDDGVKLLSDVRIRGFFIQIVSIIFTNYFCIGS
jgi:large subunit ribosomal protein L15